MPSVQQAQQRETDENVPRHVRLNSSLLLLHRSTDYDKRTALHIAAADGSLAAVKLLVEEGGANHAVQDRWGVVRACI